MQDQSRVNNVRSAIIEILRYDNKKLILPIFMTCLLLGSLIYGSYLRDHRNKDQKVIEQSKDIISSEFEANLEKEYFPNRTEYNNTEDIETQTTETRFTQADRFLLMPFGATETPLYPMNPETLGMLDLNSVELSNPLINAEDGYVWSEDYIEGVIEINYYAVKYSNLNQDLNRSNISFEEYRNRTNSIRSEEYNDGKVTETIIPFNRTRHGAISAFETTDISGDKLYNLIENYGFKEVKLIHFIPTIIGTFFMYYIVSGMILICWRESKYLLMGILNVTEDHN